MIIKNNHLLKKHERETIQLECLEILTRYNLPLDYLKEIEISKRLKITAGQIRWNIFNLKSYKIQLAYNNYQEFGFDSTLKTLRHELAHLICIARHNHKEHGEPFRRTCASLDGHMNKTIAGKKYEQYASNDYCKTEKKCKYTCPGCNQEIKRMKKISAKKLLRSSCGICKTRLIDFTYEAI